MDCATAQPLLAAYALGALGGQEKALVDNHTGSCGRCNDELRANHRAATKLSLVTSLVDPPPGLKARLLARIDTVAPKPAGYSDKVTTTARPFRRTIPAMLAGKSRTGALAFGLLAIAAVLMGWASVETISFNALKKENEALTSRMGGQWNAINLAVNPKCGRCHSTGQKHRRILGGTCSSTKKGRRP